MMMHVDVAGKGNIKLYLKLRVGETGVGQRNAFNQCFSLTGK